MSCEYWSKRAFRIAVRGCVLLLRSVTVATLVGAVLTYFNGNAPFIPSTQRHSLDVDLQLSNWKPILNFLVPFCAELLFCCLASIRTSWISLKSQSVHKSQSAIHQLKEIAEDSDVEIKVEVKRLDNGDESDDPILRGHHSWPVLSVTPSHRRAAYRTHTNSLCIFDAEELLEWKDDSSKTAMPIRPLPKEVPERVPRHKSAGCLSDVYGRRVSEVDRLHVFNNGLYSDCTTPRELKL